MEKIIKYFKGGSLSGTFIIKKQNKLLVRKQVSLKKNREFGFQRWLSQLKKVQYYNSRVKHIFPNIIDAHVSEATYYRLFVDEHLNKTSDVLIYLDADIICVDNPFEQLLQHIDKLKESDFIISVKTEHSITDSQERLGMTSNQYFNAGVMIIDYQKWFKQDPN
mgnify:CR=1 FL=1